MRLVTLVGCLVLIHGSFSLPGCGRRKEERLQRKLSGILLQKQPRKDYDRDYAPATQAPVTNVNIQNIYHDSDTNIVEKRNNIGIITNNKLDTKANINQKSDNYLNNNFTAYNADATDTVSNNYYGEEPPHSRRKREIVIKNGNQTNYKYVSQPGRSRFTYLKKVQILPEPEPEPEPKIKALTLQKTSSVKEEQTNLSEENHEEVHEEHIQTTKHLKKSSKHSKKKKSRSHSRRRSRKERKSSVTNIEESNAITNQELKKEIMIAKSTNVTETEEVSKNQKLNEIKAKETNGTTLNRSNETENSLAVKNSEVSKTELSDLTGRSIVIQKGLNNSGDLTESRDNHSTFKISQPVIHIADSAQPAVKGPKRQWHRGTKPPNRDEPPKGSSVPTFDSQRRRKTTPKPVVANAPSGHTVPQHPSVFRSPPLHLDTGLQSSLDLVSLGRRAGAPTWGVPMANAAGKVEYLSVGGGRGDIHFVPRRDSRGHTEFLYPTVDDSGRSHNIHLRTQQGHLTLVETDFQNGARSFGFLGYDDSGEYVVPVHFEQGHHLVAESRAHSLQYAVNIHPAYDIVNPVFHY